MASTESSAPTNGNYAQGYDSYAASQQQTASQPAQQASASEIPKDEVGWYFVEQYYTTLSKSPDRLYLFYNKRSQFVSGVEEEKVNVCVGQKPINERIKELDFKDTKVRVTNVDSQGSDANIVIQVIGEISNQGQPHKRFVQTFVLAEQTNGYFVLNDIFRYLAEEPEEEEEPQQEPAANGIEEPAPTAAVPADEDATQSEQVGSSEEDLSKVDQKLEEVAQEEASAEEITGTGATEVAEAEKAPEVEEVAAAPAEEAPKEAEAPVEQAVEQEEEKPKDPSPTPAPAAQKTASVAMPAGPPKPAAPRTWASLAASAHKVATPVVAAPAAQQVPKEAKAAAAAQPAAAASAQTSAPAREQSPAASQGEAGWQSVSGHKKEQSRAQNQAPAADADQKRAYIKNVYSQVQEGSLRAALSKFGEIEYLDLSRGKNAAFVDFKTPAGYQAAVAANPHTVDGVELKVEERRQRPQQFPAFPRGGGSQRGRGGPGGPRGGFVPRGRGGAPRGRGAPQES